MITDTFDKESKAVIDPEHIVKNTAKLPEVVISTFSSKFTKALLAHYDAEVAGKIAWGDYIQTYTFAYKGQQLAYCQSPIGAPAATGTIEELFAAGAKKVLYFGSCGFLDKDITFGRLIVPTAAYRDEGVSYHYIKPADFITVETADELCGIFDSMDLSYTRTKAWTTDAFYRETVNNVKARKAAGCRVVEMECASLMAVGQFRQKKVYQFFYSTDCLDGDYDLGLLDNMPATLTERIFDIALETAIKLAT